MEKNLLSLLRTNCSKLLSQTIAAANEMGLSSGNHQQSPHRPHHHTRHQPMETNETTFQPSILSILGTLVIGQSSSNLSTVALSTNESSESLLDEEKLSSFLMQQMMQQSNSKLDPNRLMSGEIGSGPSSQPMASHQQYDYIIQSHSESARNALIYVAVILAIYVVAVATIAIQYYRKHSTLDPFSAYIFRHSAGDREMAMNTSYQANRKRRRQSNGGSGIQSRTDFNLPEVRINSSNISIDAYSDATSCNESKIVCLKQSISAENVVKTETRHKQRHTGRGEMLVDVQINIEPDLVKGIDSVRGDSCGGGGGGTAIEEESDEEVDDEYEISEELPFDSKPTQPPPPPSPQPTSKRNRLRKLFTFSSGSKDSAQPPSSQPSAEISSRNEAKLLMRSYSLQSGDSHNTVRSHGEEPESRWAEAATSAAITTGADIRLFKRSSSSGFTISSATTLFKPNYEETHL